MQQQIDTKKIRKCELVTMNNIEMIQFIATGDRHKMMKHDDGSIEIIKLIEQGKDYRYGDPYPLDIAIAILIESSQIGHKTLAQQIKNHLSRSTIAS